jgi:hypothetical protein
MAAPVAAAGLAGSPLIAAGIQGGLQGLGAMLASKGMDDEGRSSFADVGYNEAGELAGEGENLHSLVSPINNLGRFIIGVNTTGADIFDEITGTPINFETEMQTPASVTGGFGPAGMFSIGDDGQVASMQDQGYEGLDALGNWTQPFDRSTLALGQPRTTDVLMTPEHIRNWDGTQFGGGHLEEGEPDLGKPNNPGGYDYDEGLPYTMPRSQGAPAGGPFSGGSRFVGDLGDTALAGGEAERAMQLIASSQRRRRR